MSDELRVTYATFKALAASKNLPIQYTEDTSGSYYLALADGILTWGTVIAAGSSDATDFETNFKASANAPVISHTGNWSYLAGTTGTVNVSAGYRVVAVTAFTSQTNATLTINGGNTITIPANLGISLTIRGLLVAPVFIFTNIDTYFVELVN